MREERLARTEALFRDVNERIAESAEGFDADHADFVCECGEQDCTERVPATLDDSTLPAASQYYFGGGVAVISILVYNLGDFLGNFISAGIAIAMAFCAVRNMDLPT